MFVFWGRQKKSKYFCWCRIVVEILHKKGIQHFVMHYFLLGLWNWGLNLSYWVTQVDLTAQSSIQRNTICPFYMKKNMNCYRGWETVQFASSCNKFWWLCEVCFVDVSRAFFKERILIEIRLRYLFRSTRKYCKICVSRFFTLFTWWSVGLPSLSHLNVCRSGQK